MCNAVKCICKEVACTNITDWITAIATCFTALAAFFTFFLARKQLYRISSTDSSRFLLELREAFSEERRWKVHYDIKNEIVDKKYVDDNDTELNDYLGLFEICEEMISNGSLVQEVFKKLYYFRLECLLDCEPIVKYLRESIEYWPNLINLFKRFPELKEDYYETPEQILFWEKIEDE